MKLLDFQEIETLLAPYFLQKGHFFIFFEKNVFFLNTVIDFGETPPLGGFAFLKKFSLFMFRGEAGRQNMKIFVKSK